jgi:hypothetical protein
MAAKMWSNLRMIRSAVAQEKLTASTALKIARQIKGLLDSA